MDDSRVIQVFEYGWLNVGEKYGEDRVEFRLNHFLQLQQYLTQNPNSGYFSVYYNRIRFANYVGVIRVADLTIEILPKVEKYNAGKKDWQKVLIEMLAISMSIEAETTTFAKIQTQQLSVLETYIHLFLSETERIIHQGLIKKYRRQRGNQNVLNGKLLLQQHITKNLVHSERFYVEHQIFDRDNVYNQLLFQTLLCIKSLDISIITSKWCNWLLLLFPECNSLHINNNLFKRISLDRKSLRYKTAIELARIILLNFHPDIKGGNENILAIMFDMNELWEAYIYSMLSRASRKIDSACKIKYHNKEYFWRHPDKWRFKLIPDLVIEDIVSGNNLIIDTKWKYDSSTSIEDVRQMYTYGHFFNAKRRYLLYPARLDNKAPIIFRDGFYYDINSRSDSKEEICGIIYIDILNNEKKLNKDIGKSILNKCLEN